MDDTEKWQGFEDTIRELREQNTALLARLQKSEARMAEPDWSQAPDWANYWCVDADGKAWWEEAEPEVYMSMWNHRGSFMTAGAVDLIAGVDWRMTLRQRLIELGG